MKLEVEYSRVWRCQVFDSGYHNGCRCGPEEPHGSRWQCAYVWVAPRFADCVYCQSAPATAKGRLCTLCAAHSSYSATRHGFTEHGHDCCTLAPRREPGHQLASCGGLSLCERCRFDAEQIHGERGQNERA